MSANEQGPIIGGHRSNNRRTLYGDRWYQSKMEADFAARLDFEKRAGIIRRWDPQVRLAIEVPAPAGAEDARPIVVAHYVVDFDITYATGRRRLVETKGYWTAVAKLKRRVFEATWLRAHPDVEYSVVTRLDAFGAATEEPTPAAATRRPSRQRSISAAEFRAMRRPA
jgi:hypothetical protein